MVKLFATKTISGNPYDAMDTTFVSIFSYFSPKEAIYYVEAPQDFKEVGAVRKISLKFNNKILRLLEKLILMKKLKPDYLFGYGAVVDLPFVFFKPKNTKYIMNFHSILILKGTSYWPVRTPWFLRKFLFEKADIVVAISESARHTILNYFPEKRIELIYSGVDLDFFIPGKRDRDYLQRKFQINFDKPLIVYVGTLQPRKRPDIFIKVASRYPKANFLMIGRGDNKFLEPTQKLSNFQYIEWLDRENIAKLFASADVFLFPSLQEPFGLVVVEAMAAGLPVVVSASGAFPELVKEGEDGFLIPIDNNEVNNFIAALDKLLNDIELRKNLSTNAVINVKRFSWENTAVGYKRILLKV